MKRLVLFVASALLLAAAPAHATLQQVRVTAVGIDRLSTRAEAKAREFAKQRAVYLVVRKLPVKDPIALVAKLTPEEWHEIVRGVDVLQTRRVGERTYIEANVSVMDTVLRRSLGLAEREIEDFTEAATSLRPILVIPVFVKRDRPYLWEKENALREPVRSEMLRQMHGAALLPGGELDDRRLVDYQNVLYVKGPDLAPMFARYGADEIVIPIFTASAPDAPPPARVLLRRLTLATTRTEALTLELPQKDISTEDQLAQAAEQITTAVMQIASSTSAGDQKRLEAATKIPVVFAYANPRELAQMQRSLREQAGVLLVKMPAIALQDMAATVYYEGEPQKLREKLSKTGMIVADQGETWKLSYR